MLGVTILSVFTIINLGLTFMNLKMYTEYFKDKIISGRK
jgi:ABC-type glucose/galactose transport system permease subunit